MDNRWVVMKQRVLTSFKTRREVALKAELMGMIPFIESVGPGHMPDAETAQALSDLRAAYYKFVILLPLEYSFEEAKTQVTYTSPGPRQSLSQVDLYKTDPSDIDDI
jgi:hypothetical protein